MANYCRAHDRSAADSVAVAPSDATPEQLPQLAAAGVTEFVVVASPPDDVRAVPEWTAALARRRTLESAAGVI